MIDDHKLSCPQKWLIPMVSCVYIPTHTHTHTLSLSLSLYLFQSMSYSLMFKCRYTERLKNTLIHEMCHAAVWIVDGIKDGGHRRHWRAWWLWHFLHDVDLVPLTPPLLFLSLLVYIRMYRSSKANSVHPDLDPITRCHSYDISYKFHYHCTRCDYKYVRHCIYVPLSLYVCPSLVYLLFSSRLGRHSKSVNLTDARCPYCLRYIHAHITQGTTITRNIHMYTRVGCQARQVYLNAQCVKELSAVVRH